MLPKTTTTLTYFPFFHFDVESSAYSNCTESQLALCESQFNENSLPVCVEVIELKTCLAACENIKERSSWNVYTKYEALVRKMNSYPDCIPESKVSKKKCNEEFVNNCYQQYNHNATPICPEVKKLRMCISELTGCHAMKHPKFVQSRDILEKHRDCFFVNYSRILEVLKNKGQCTSVLLSNSWDNQSSSQKVPTCGSSLPLLPSFLFVCFYKYFLSLACICYVSIYTLSDLDDLSYLIGLLSQTVQQYSLRTTKTSTSEKPSESEPEQQSGHLPYTFVVVATVCTCMFLVVLVVFSIVRHTTLSKRQRNSSIERAPMRIRIRSHSPSHRTRHHRHRRSSRGHVVMHGAVRQTVSGFFEGNVAPPPYSAVLDDTESVRAGDPPPPYRPPSHIGVIV
ncbi:unnamed protein product [Porites evermanni]|uniref:Uncharacterized protein n=1 Tax=Porites evermanni TaxID=104178 RepID=A0ABN8LW34_9CNID|nr:unnamed protein product [Porites evermanni]